MANRRMNTQLAKRKQDLINKSFGNDAAYKIPVDSDLIIADVSGSMADIAFEGKRKIDCLREAVSPFVGRCAVLAFSDNCFEVQADAIPDPMIGTNLTRAIDHAITVKPIHVLVCCDGAPDNSESALASAAKLAEDCIIDTLYIGPLPKEVKEGETPDWQQVGINRAIEFMKQLARVGRGRYVQFDINKQSPLLLGKTVDAMLALPSPDSIIL